VIVDDLNLAGIPISPNKAETPLVIDSYPMSPLSVPMQCFQAVPRRSCHIPQLCRAVQLPQLSAGDFLDCLKAPAALPLVKALSLDRPE